MFNERKQNLEKNFSRMFWIQALLNIKTIGVVSTLFYLHRGLTLPEIFYLAVTWGVVSLIFEVPSSYMADKWGRKRTIILGILMCLLHWIIFIFAHNMIWFLIGIALMSISFSFFTGTADALVYDTNRELGKDDESLTALGKFYSGREVFRFVVPLLAAYIARDLLEWQFVVILLIDIFVTILSFVFAFRLVEPNHYMDVEETEAGVILDAWNLIRKDWVLIKAILSRTLILMSMFVIWRFHQKFFIDIGIPIIMLGVASSAIALAKFFLNRNSESILSKMSVSRKIDNLNIIYACIMAIFVVSLFLFPNNYWLLFLYILFIIAESSRWPLYSDFYNKRSKSFNRATTLSLANLIKSILDPFILLFAGFLISKNIEYPFYFSLFLAIIVVVFFRLSSSKCNSNLQV